MANRWGNSGNGGWLYFWGAPESLQMVIAAMKLKDAYSLEGKLWPTRQHIVKQRHYFVNKDLSSQDYGFSSGHVWMWELDCEERWAPKNWCFWTVVLEKTLESPLDCKEIQSVHSKGDQSWVFFGRNDAKAETPVLWPPHAKSWLIGKDPDAGRDWGQEEKGTTEDEMAGVSLTRWTWVSVNFGSWWWTGRPGVLRFMGSQRVGHNWATDLIWSDVLKINAWGHKGWTTQTPLALREDSSSSFRLLTQLMNTWKVLPPP